MRAILPLMAGAVIGLIGPAQARSLDTIRSFFTGQMPVVLVDVGFMFLFIGTLMFISPTLGLITVAAVPVFLLISIAFHRLQKGLAEKTFAALAAKTSTLTETVTNALTIKSLGLESEMEKRWGGRLALTAHTGFESNNLANIVRMSERVGHITGELRAFSRKAMPETTPIPLKETVDSSLLLNRSRQ